MHLACRPGLEANEKALEKIAFYFHTKLCANKKALGLPLPKQIDFWLILSFVLFGLNHIYSHI